MKGYTVQLLFHLLAVLAGGACGAAAGFWLFADNVAAMWVSAGALLAGMAVLGLQLFYLRDGLDRAGSSPATSGHSSPRIDVHSPDHAQRHNSTARTRVQDHGASGDRSRTATSTRPDLEPVDEDTGTRRTADSPRTERTDDEEERSVAAAFERRRRADPTTRRW